MNLILIVAGGCHDFCEVNVILFVRYDFDNFYKISVIFFPSLIDKNLLKQVLHGFVQSHAGISVLTDFSAMTLVNMPSALVLLLASVAWHILGIYFLSGNSPCQDPAGNQTT